ncbi:MAG TPA: FecR family protein, partial [Allocoleopsis sp.]
MIRRTVTFIAAALSSTLLLAIDVHAQTPLNRAVLEALRNNVQLLPEDQSPRSARVSDVVTPGDGVSTASGAFAELRFNDGSLGRLGEQVVFWFTSGSRDFRLSNGTVLMLIPPGQGRTQIRTPNAAAGIQGSALFVRYIAETNTTIVGALTDSGIEVFNEDGSQRQRLRGGQMAVAVGDQIEHIYDFDLKTFYETSELIQGLSPLDTMPTSPAGDPAVRQVQAEMQTAIEQQPSFSTDNVIGTPSFVQMPEGTPGEYPSLPETVPPPDAFPSPNGLATEQPGAGNTSDVLNSGGEIQRSITGDRPATEVLQNQVEQTILDPRREEQVNPNRGNPDRPGNGN